MHVVFFVTLKTLHSLKVGPVKLFPPITLSFCLGIFFAHVNESKISEFTAHPLANDKVLLLLKLVISCKRNNNNANPQKNAMNNMNIALFSD